MAAFVKSVADVLPNFSIPPRFLIQKVSQNAPINATTTITQALPTNITVHQGYVRVRLSAYPDAGAGQCTKLKITVTDGTTTLVLDTINTFDASDLFDYVCPFVVDLGVNSVSVAVTMANVVNGRGTIDLELGGNT